VNQIKTADALPQLRIPRNCQTVCIAQNRLQVVTSLRNMEKHRAYMLAFVTAIIAITDDIPLSAKRNSGMNDARGMRVVRQVVVP